MLLQGLCVLYWNPSVFFPALQYPKQRDRLRDPLNSFLEAFDLSLQFSSHEIFIYIHIYIFIANLVRGWHVLLQSFIVFWLCSRRVSVFRFFKGSPRAHFLSMKRCNASQVPRRKWVVPAVCCQPSPATCSETERHIWAEEIPVYAQTNRRHTRNPLSNPLKPVWIIWSLLEVALIYRASFAAASCGRPLSADFKRGRNGIANPGGYQIDSSSKKWYISTVNQIETSSRWSILKPVHRNEAAGEPSEWCPVHKVKVVPGVKQSLHGFQMFSKFSRFLTFWNGFADILGSSWIK